MNGYVQAYVRFEDVAKGVDAEEAFHALFETLAWAASLDERLDYPNVPELRGLRFARHRVHHQWADALWLDESGMSFPVSFPIVYFEWRWRDVDQLPTGKPSRDEPAYTEHLAGLPARVTMGMVGGFLRSLPGGSSGTD